MSLPCPIWPEKCSTALKCAAILEAHQCPFDTKKNRKKCCVTEKCDPPLILSSFKQTRSARDGKVCKKI